MAITTGSKAEINVTPMIDVLLVLLIIFMVIIPHNSTGLDANIPGPPSDDTPSPAHFDVVVNVRPDRSVEVNAELVGWEDLGERLRQVVTRQPGSNVFIGGAPGLDFADIARVLDAARGVGIGRVGLIR